MNRKKRLSITIVILVPVFILGALAVFSNIAAISNLKRVNMTAVTIADEHMINISQLSNIEKELQEIHKKALSHIIATDLDTLIATVDEVRAEQEVLDQYLAEYKNSLEEEDTIAYNTILSNYDTMKYEIANLMAFSGNAEKEKAFILANGTIKQCSDEMQRQVEGMMERAQESASQASDALTAEYNKAVLKNTIIVVLSIIAFLITLYSVFILMNGR